MGRCAAVAGFADAWLQRHVSFSLSSAAASLSDARPLDLPGVSGTARFGQRKCRGARRLVSIER